MWPASTVLELWVYTTTPGILQLPQISKENRIKTRIFILLFKATDSMKLLDSIKQTFQSRHMVKLSQEKAISVGSRYGRASDCVTRDTELSFTISRNT